MKKIFFLIFLFCVFGCENNVPKGSLKLDNVEKIKLLSYPSRIFWENNNNYQIKNIDSVIKSNNIIDDISLGEKDKKKIIALLEDEYFFKSNAACYDPRHLVLFCDSNDRILGYYEMCLECGGWDSSENLDYLPAFCIEKGEVFKRIFEEIGLKNTGRESKITHKKEQFLLSKRLNSDLK